MPVGKKAHVFFEQVAPQLIDDHYNWFIIIEPNSGDYFIDSEEEIAIQWSFDVGVNGEVRRHRN